MPCRAIRNGELCGAPIQREVTTAGGRRLQMCRLHWMLSDSGAPVEVLPVEVLPPIVPESQ